MDGWLLLAVVVKIAPGTPWTPALSDKLDRFILQQRRAQAYEMAHSMRLGLQPHSRTIAGPDVPCRGDASQEELERRRAAAAYLTAAGPANSWPQPRLLRNGRWLACVIHRGVRHRRTFDTYDQATEFIRLVKTDNYREAS